MKVVAKNVEMIAHFEESGKIKPIRFRYKEDDNYIVIKINKIISTANEKLCGNIMYVYTCSTVINNVERLFELKFDLENTRWILFKI